MTREEAKKTLETLMYYPIGTVPKDKCVDALNMAIKALEQEPTAEYSSDVISREEVKKQTTKKNSIWNTITDSSGRGLDEILDSIPSAQLFTTEQIQTMQELESAQIEKAYELGKADRPTGHWINDTRYLGWTCSRCNYHDGNRTDRYCPNCGARMESEEE